MIEEKKMRLPKDFSFFCPLKINCGHHALAHLPMELSAVGACAPLILADRDQVGKKRIKTVVDAFKTSGLTVGIFDRLTDQSGPDLLPLLSRIYADGGCDSIVAVGGGSVVDTAKCLNLMVSAGDRGQVVDPDRDDAEPGPLRPLMLIATTGGNGDEATGYASDGNQRLCSPRLVPAVAFIDPAMMGERDDLEVVDGAMLALVHAVEAFLDESAGPMGRAYAHTAIGLIVTCLPLALRNTERKKNLCAVVNGQVAASCAYSAASPGICHTLARELKDGTDFPSGMLMAMLLPYLLAEAGNVHSEQVGNLLYPLAGAETFAMTASELKTPRVIALLWEFYDAVNARLDLKIPSRLGDTGLADEQINRVLSQWRSGSADDCPARIIESARKGATPMVR
jgi:alcohol dehydrogenase